MSETNLEEVFDHQLAKYLLICLEAEREIENQRTILGRIPFFDPKAAFKRLHRKQTQKIDLQDITKFLK